MTLRARIPGVVAVLAVALITSACQSGGAPAHPPDAGGDMGGMHMGGMDRGGAGTRPAAHDAALPPLTDRLAAATPEQRAATADLLARTKATLAAYASEPAARAAGFVPADVTKRVIHYRNVANRRDDHELDPSRPEGLVYFHGPAGGLVLLGALYTARPGEVAPTPGGDLFSWHTHDPTCGTFLVSAGGCTSTFRMLHVWVAPGAPDPWVQPIRLAFGRSA
jgi:hypothetical protein